LSDLNLWILENSSRKRMMLRSEEENNINYFLI
jgi:hypothetical protein